MKYFSLYFSVLFVLFPASTSSKCIADNYPGFGNQVIQSGVWSIFRNPAGIASIKGFEAGTFYRRSMFLDELSTKGFVFSVPFTKKTPVALGFQRFGYQLYHETKINFGLARSFGDKLKTGVSFDYHHYAFGSDYGNYSYITATAGIILLVSKQVYAGVSYSAPTRIYSFQDSGHLLKTDVAAALSWSPGSHLVISTGLSKVEDRTHEISLDIIYRPFKKFDLNAGVSTGLAPFHFGYSFQLLRCRIGMMAGYHFSTGFTPQIAISYKKHS